MSCARRFPRGRGPSRTSVQILGCRARGAQKHGGCRIAAPGGNVQRRTYSLASMAGPRQRLLAGRPGGGRGSPSAPLGERPGGRGPSRRPPGPSGSHHDHRRAGATTRLGAVPHDGRCRDRSIRPIRDGPRLLTRGRHRPAAHLRGGGGGRHPGRCGRARRGGGRHPGRPAGMDGARRRLAPAGRPRRRALVPGPAGDTRDG